MSLFGAAQYNVIELFGGEDFKTIITASANGVPIDVTGNKVINEKFTVRRSPFYYKDVHSFNVRKVEPYTNGIFEISYPASLTKTIKAGRHMFDFTIDLLVDDSDPENLVYTTVKVAYGIVIVYPSITLEANESYPF